MEDTPRIIGLDIGTKRTGVSLSDAIGFLSNPYATIETRDPHQWVKQVIEILNKESVQSVVIGMPLNQYGEEGDDAIRVRKYIDLLRSRVEIPVIEWDERFTTVQAERTLLEADLSRAKRKQVIDKVAATIILQGYLDSKRCQAPFTEEFDQNSP